MQRVLVTGATGFIGSQVVRALVAEGCDVHVLLRPGSRRLTRLEDIRAQLSVIEGDLEAVDDLRGALERAQVDACIHLAWFVEPGAYLASPQNTAMLTSSIRLFEALADAGCRRFVSAGTNFEYDSNVGWLDEGAPVRPSSLYAATKLSLFQVLEQLSAQRQVSFAWTRIFYQYGPFENERRLVPAVILPLLRGHEARVTAGEQVRDFLHVEDVARAVSLIARSEVTGAVNVGSGVPITVRDLCLAIADRCGRRDGLILGALPYRPGDPMFVCANTAKLRSLGFRPLHDLASGIDSAVRWWSAQPGVHSEVRP